MCQRKPLNSILVLASALCATTARAQVIEWVPVSSTGPSTIVGNEIILPAGVAQVQFDIVVYGWGGAPLYEDLGAYTATLVGADLLGVNASPPNPGVDLTTPEQVPCQSEADCPTGRCGSFQAGFCDDNQPGFQFARMCLNDQSMPCSTGSQCPGMPICIWNADFVLSGCEPFLAVALPANRNYEFIGACQSSLVIDTGIPRYAGSLRIDVPVNAEGTYEITFNPSNERTFLNVIEFTPPSLTLISGLITLPTDCNNNGLADWDEIANGQASDCNRNGFPDECDGGDCNDNDILDSCDLENMTSDDCNSDGVPDECQLVANDCNVNDVPDECDISGGQSTDCNLNGVPDSCEPDDDCDTNGVQDICDVAAGAPDCNFNEIPDDCEPDEDCNTNGVRDICDIGAGTALDCNRNSIPDGCDLAAGSSPDTNGNSVPDECEVATPPVPDAPHHWRKNRFISFTPLVTNNMPVAYRVELLDHQCADSGEKCTDLSDCTVCSGGSRVNKPCSHGSECPGGSCVVSGQLCVENSPPIALGWVGDPIEVRERPFAGIPPDLFTSLVVKQQPSARLWPEEVIHVGDCEIAPAQSYALSATMDGIVFSDPLLIGTVPKPLEKNWGDVVGKIIDTNADGMGDTWTPPNGLSNVDDVVAWLRFKAGRLAPHITALELDSEVPNFIANVTDLALILQGFKGRSYPPPPFPNQGAVTECP